MTENSDKAPVVAERICRKGRRRPNGVCTNGKTILQGNGKGINGSQMRFEKKENLEYGPSIPYPQSEHHQQSLYWEDQTPVSPPPMI